MKIQACELEGCSRCFEAKSCISCKEGFYISKKDESNGTSVVECSPCGIKNCMYCKDKKGEINGQTFKECTICENGFGLING